MGRQPSKGKNGRQKNTYYTQGKCPFMGISRTVPGTEAGNNSAKTNYGVGRGAADGCPSALRTGGDSEQINV